MRWIFVSPGQQILLCTAMYLASMFSVYHEIFLTFHINAMNVPIIEYNNINYSFKLNKKLNCLPCNYTATNTNPNSQENDVIFAYASGSLQNLMAFIRTLRHTGSKCATVFFVDDKALSSIGEREMKYLEDCGAQLINIHKRMFSDDFSIYAEVYMHMYRFLMLHRHRLNRVIKLDMYDVFFQGDPFDESMPSGALQVVPELNIIHRPYGHWITSCGRVPNRSSFDMICAGYFAGDADVVYRFVKFFAAHRPKDAMDQACLNSWYYNRDLENAGISVLSMPKARVLHMWEIGRKGREFGDIRTGYEPYHVASLIHHVHHYCYTVESLKDKYCPPPYPDFPNYVVKCKNNFNK